MRSSAIAELETPSRVACSDLLDHVFMNHKTGFLAPIDDSPSQQRLSFLSDVDRQPIYNKNSICRDGVLTRETKQP